VLGFGFLRDILITQFEYFLHKALVLGIAKFQRVDLAMKLLKKVVMLFYFFCFTFSQSTILHLAWFPLLVLILAG